MSNRSGQLAMEHNYHITLIILLLHDKIRKIPTRKKAAKHCVERETTPHYQSRKRGEMGVR